MPLNYIMSLEKLNGKLITFEGIEGSGKTTLINNVSKYLTKKKIPHIKTSIFSIPEVNKLIKDFILKKNTSNYTELLLFLAAHIQHIHRIIIPSIQNKICVLCDRYIYSLYAYQGYGRGIETTKIKNILKLLNFYIHPNITFFLNISVRTAIDRIETRGRLDEIEKENTNFFEKVKSFYTEIAYKNNSIKIIDAEEPQKKINDIVINILKKL